MAKSIKLIVKADDPATINVGANISVSINKDPSLKPVTVNVTANVPAAINKGSLFAPSVNFIATGSSGSKGTVGIKGDKGDKGEDGIGLTTAQAIQISDNEYSIQSVSANNWVTENRILDGSVTSSKIEDDSITIDKLANSINTAIADNTAKVEDRNYVHNQSSSSASWVVTHGLGKYPSTTVVDSAGTVVIGVVDYDSLNQITLRFKASFSGKAYFN